MIQHLKKMKQKIIDKIIFMKEIIDTFTKDKVERLLSIGEVKTEEKEIPYLSVDVEKYLETFKEE